MNVSVIYEENEESKSKMLIHSTPINRSSSNKGQHTVQNQIGCGGTLKGNANDFSYTNKALNNIEHVAVEEVDGEESDDVKREEHKQATPAPLNLLKPEDISQNRAGRLHGAPVILIERFSSKKIANNLLHALLNSSIEPQEPQRLPVPDDNRLKD